MLAVVAGGGTGGHAIPAKILIDNMIEKGISVVYVGSINGIETKIMDEKCNRVFLNVSGIKGKSFFSALKGAVLILASFIKMLFYFLKSKPDFIIGVGGFVSVPSLMAGILLKIPIYLQEQNSVPGTATKYFSRYSRKIFLGFEDMSHTLPTERVVITGNPVRNDFLRPFEYKRLRKNEKMIILVLGGSRGAKFLNDLVLKTIQFLDKTKFEFIHQTGILEKDRVLNAYKNAGISAEVFDYSSNIIDYYKKSHFIIARAGAMTVTEILFLKIPALFIPYPHAIYDHQAKNAEFAVKIGLAMMFRENEISEVKLREILTDLYENPDKLDKMSKTAYSFEVSNPAEKIVNIIMEDLGV